MTDVTGVPANVHTPARYSDVKVTPSSRSGLSHVCTRVTRVELPTAAGRRATTAPLRRVMEGS
jgi:hypothetical protein